MKPCAIYARSSSELQRTTSIEDQVRNCRQFAAHAGWAVLDDHVYQDRALSGYGVEHRPAYQRLIATALSPRPPFSVILVDDLSRLLRDLAETLRLYRRFTRHGIELVSVAEATQTSEQMGQAPDHDQGLGQRALSGRPPGQDPPGPSRPGIERPQYRRPVVRLPNGSPGG